MNKELCYNLTHPQKRIWYSEKLHPGTGMWNNAGTLKIKGHINYALLEKALNIFVMENEAARLTISIKDAAPYQYVSEYKPFTIELMDFSARGVQKLYEWDSMQTQAPMPLVDSPLFYFALIRISDEEGGFYVKFHHIISDAISIVSFTNQVTDTYKRLLCGEELSREARSSYIEYIREESDYLNSARFESDRQYWTQRFMQLPEPTVLKQKKTPYFSTVAKRKAFIISEELSADIRSYCLSQRVSVFSLFLSALAIYINRITGKSDIIIGSPVANRTSKNTRNTCGMFVSTVPVRIQINDDLKFSEFIGVVSSEWFSALKHQKYPYDLLLQELRKTHKGLDSLYDVTLSYQYGTFEKSNELFSQEGRWHFCGYQADSLSIHVNDREGSGKFIVDYDHHHPFFSAKEVEYIHAHIINIVGQMMAHPDKPLYMAELMSDEEKHRILTKFNETARTFPQGETLVDLWNKRMAVVPDDAIAIINQGQQMTYRELDDRSSALAGLLVQRGVKADSIVALLTERTFDYCVGALAIIKAGGAFLPIDASLPDERISYMVKDSGAAVLLVSPHLSGRCTASEGLCVITTDSSAAQQGVGVVMPLCKPENLAYVIYTSGSTGQPKGVQIEHHSIVHFVYSLSEIWDLSPGARILGAASISFDISVMELVLSLMSGNTLVLAQEHEVNIPRNMVSLIKAAQVNVMCVTPGRMELLLSDNQGSACLANFREIGMGGDVLSEKLLARVQQSTSARITNFYGPTEITICCTCTDVTRAKVPNIGSPMPNVKAYILDTHQSAVPIGVPGELYIGGCGLARGYIGKHDLNSERFVDNPFVPGEKLYRTGDLTRWYPLGEIEFLGRIDKQVKIRGYRIELGEIENRLMQIEGITACVVADRIDASGRRYLCAYLCGQPPKKAQIRAQLMRDLPSYMIPSYFVAMEQLPFNASGKVDKNLLPDPLEGGEAAKEDFVPPETQTEKALAQIWNDVLAIGVIGRNDSFFEIGGDSLSIVNVMARVQQHFQVDIALDEIYRAPYLKDYASLIDTASKSAFRPIVCAPEAQDYPVSSAQQRMWILANTQGPSVAYNMPALFTLSEKPDMERLKNAFDRVIARHDAFRTSFVLRDESLRQKIYRNVEFEIGSIKFSAKNLKTQIKKLVVPFDMSQAPLLRASLLEIEEHSYALFMDMHHSISDRRTMEIFISDLVRSYNGESLENQPLQYKDFAVWQQEYLQSDSVKLQKEHWKTTLSGELPLLNLRTDKPRGAVQHFDGARMRFNVGKQTADMLRDFATQRGATLFMAVLSVYNVLLSKYTGQEDIIVGTPVSGRPRPELQDMAGVFINTLPLRNHPRGDLSFLEFFDELCQSTVAALAHADYPFERMIADLNLSRDAARNPLFDTMLVQTKNMDRFKLGDIQVNHQPFDPGVAKLDLTLEVCETDSGLECEFEYNTRLFKRSTIKRMAGHFCRLTELLPQEAGTRLCDTAMLSQQELWQVTQGFNQTDFPLDPNISIQSLLEEHAAQQGDKTALIVNGEKMTFEALNRRANCIAHALRAQGVGRNTIVAICIRRSFDMIAAIFGVLKAGGAYMPLDTSYPADRIAFMLSDSSALILLTDGSADVPFNGQTLCVQDISDEGSCGNLERIDRPEDIAYVMYTSGSTGLPKGTVLQRRGLLNFYEGVKGPVNYDPNQTSVSITTVSFDIFICDAVLPLLNGCTVVLCSEEELRQPDLLAVVIEQNGVKFIQATPTRMRAMMDYPYFREAMRSHIEKIMIGGEMVPLSLVKLLRKHFAAQIINAYGPTETTVYSSFKDLTKASQITIGKPIANTRIYVLDKYKRPVPVGVLGEAYISGAGVSIGYINRDELNRKTFIPDPYWPGHMMYKTGDVCAFLEDGDLIMCGRVDHQVKIRGLRIELGEIEAALRSVKGVEEAVVKDWGEGAEKYLCAYYQTDQDISLEIIREQLLKKLPLYMIPSYYVSMKELPTTLNGKVNRKLLLEPDKSLIKGKASAQTTQMSEKERMMARIWSRILRVKDVSPDDSFFALGGDSLGVIKVQAAVLQYGWSIRTQDFYDLQTLRKICARINTKTSAAVKHVSPVKGGTNPVPEFQHLSQAKLDNVFITGATGYLGAYLLERLADVPDARIYCLVRGSSNEECRQRLRKVLTFYFGIETCAYIFGRISVIKGDAAEEGLGIDSDVRARLRKIDTVIHCAALTDHVGQAELFERANVTATRNVTRFAERLGAALMHISTVSVSGTHYTAAPDRKGEFTEECYYVGQNYEDNEYAKSKFLAEGIVLDAIAKGLDARIYRVGVLTGTLDGRFQMKPERNAFANRLKTLCALGCVPISMLAAHMEMTPVDSCAQAILDLATLTDSKQPIYHVFNTNILKLGEIISMLEQIGYHFNILSNTDFLKEIKRHSKKENYGMLIGLMTDIISHKERQDIIVTADKTSQLLSKIGFEWPVIDSKYLDHFLGSIDSGALKER